MNQVIFSAQEATELVLDQIIPEINDEIREACEEHKNYIVHEFKNVDTNTLSLINFIIEQYENKGYKIARKDDSTYMISWVF